MAEKPDTEIKAIKAIYDRGQRDLITTMREVLKRSTYEPDYKAIIGTFLDFMAQAIEANAGLKSASVGAQISVDTSKEQEHS